MKPAGLLGLNVICFTACLIPTVLFKCTFDPPAGHTDPQN